MQAKKGQKNVLRNWMQLASADERAELAKSSGTTVGHLHQISGSYRTEGVPSTKPWLAKRLEQASLLLARTRLKPMRREELCVACGSCDLAEKARAAESQLPTTSANAVGGGL